VNPRLRSAGERARALKKRGIDANAAVTAVRTAGGTDRSGGADRSGTAGRSGGDAEGRTA
jgi:peptide/nickel transport system permease protein